MTKDKLALNLKDLKRRIPTKPQIYTPEHPRTIKEALTYYCNQRTINALQACTKSLSDDNWPLPLWFNPINIRIGFWNRLYFQGLSNSWSKKVRLKKLHDFDFFSVLVFNRILFKRTYEEILLEAFDANLKYAFQSLMENQLLQKKKPIIESMYRNYKKRDWVACIIILFPIIDFVTRRILKTKNLGIDVSRICKLFDQNGFSLENVDNLMPHIAFSFSRKKGQPYFDEESLEWLRKLGEFDFGLIGPALSSFIRFANIYYAYYKEDEEKEEEISVLNRHAILHGSINHFGTKVNTIKLLTFLYLMLELESVLDTLFAE